MKRKIHSGLFVCQIIRGNLNGSQQEPLPILTVAKELNVDAVEGFIYWSTGHAVESSRLNGKHKKTYYPAELFSEKRGYNLIINILMVSKNTTVKKNL